MDFPSTVVSEGSAVFHHGSLLLLFHNIYKNCITFEIRIFPWKNLIFQTVLLAKSEKK